ncbi:hypothetical protein BCR32DRAFT_267567 [Anaeromyces robustus]|uniref:Uncharacterized protein n=1 Tax=Anaeromyces robustus TaxID=1754192 RepID=A0A1Y1XA06_9FUNG|nr:hypothetical protein BCR32DRAFT_267567 [Anaeromyces robustus]|eukprot:ORX82559.1 hypothetical protein BCR32DRAFT_267567 [Anaeromyces robustus]
MSRLIIKKYPEYSYLINTEKLRESRKNSGRKYSSISSTLRKKSIEVTPLTEEKTSIIKSMELNSINENTTDNQNSDDGNNESEDEEVSYQEKYSGFIDPNIEVITTKNKKNVIKKESKAVTKIIQVSNDLRKWTDENLSKKQIEPLDQYLGRSGHNIFEGKKSYRLSLPSITMAKDEDDPDNLNENESNNNDNQKNKKKKNKKDNEFDILLNACRLMVLDSKPPMPIHVTEEHNTPYEYLEKITNNLGVEISKVKQAKNKTKNKKKNSNSNTERFLYGNWYISPSKWNIMKERREQCRSVQMYPSSENWNKYIKFHKYLESPYNFENKCSDSQSDNE